MFTHRPERLRSFDYRGFHRYFLTFCTDQRRAVFSDAANVGLARTQIMRAAAQEGFELIAYCFMPDHVHLLAEGHQPDADARRFIVRAKQLSGYAFARSRRDERLWQRYGFEHVLRGEDDTLAVAKYILENPVRGRLVSSPDQYEFSGCPARSMEAVLDATAWSPRASGKIQSGKGRSG